MQQFKVLQRPCTSEQTRGAANAAGLATAAPEAAGDNFRFVLSTLGLHLAISFRASRIELAWNRPHLNHTSMIRPAHVMWRR
ncbi:hypothetical protein CUJ84_Chr002867 [Rhizobium leguminosarum]|uniref:Uncharacterized protein n=1 Tax=Rhizobium leguminosarum TaxID=384 RepID=A0A2K9Z4P2_RHILE|nr:hypothetical protein CUJ84_Chr002867 [Rhizobium leguminosarum]